MNVTQIFLARDQQVAGMYPCEDLTFIKQIALSGQSSFSLSVGPAILVEINFNLAILGFYVRYYIC